MYKSLQSRGLLMYFQLKFAPNPETKSIPSKIIIEEDPNKALELLFPVEESNHVCLHKRKQIQQAESCDRWTNGSALKPLTLYPICSLPTWRWKEMEVVNHLHVLQLYCEHHLHPKQSWMDYHAFLQCFLYRDIQNMAKHLTKICLYLTFEKQAHRNRERIIQVHTPILCPPIFSDWTWHCPSDSEVRSIPQTSWREWCMLLPKNTAASASTRPSMHPVCKASEACQTCSEVHQLCLQLCLGLLSCKSNLFLLTR